MTSSSCRARIGSQVPTAWSSKLIDTDSAGQPANTVTRSSAAIRGCHSHAATIMPIEQAGPRCTSKLTTEPCSSAP